MGINKSVALKTVFFLKLVVVINYTLGNQHASIYYWKYDVAGGYSHDLLLGHRDFKKESLVYQRIFQANPSPGRRTTIHIPIIPVFDTQILSYIEILDLLRDGTNGFPRIIKGGVGYPNATIEITSQKAGSLFFNVSAYAIQDFDKTG